MLVSHVLTHVKVALQEPNRTRSSYHRPGTYHYGCEVERRQPTWLADIQRELPDERGSHAYRIEFPRPREAVADGCYAERSKLQVVSYG
jgi:hypothetical protein